MGIGFGKIVKTCRSRSTAAMALRAACSSINITDYTHTLCRYSGTGVIRDTNRASFVWEVYPDLTPPRAQPQQITIHYPTTLGKPPFLVEYNRPARGPLSPWVDTSALPNPGRRLIRPACSSLNATSRASGCSTPTLAHPVVRTSTRKNEIL